MFKFSRKSKEKLETCCPELKELFNEVIKYHDCKILEGHRSTERQNQLFREGKSKVIGGQSKHNTYPSLAIDVVPYPIDWNDHNRFYYFAGLVQGIAHRLGLKIRWGGDWDGDNNLKDQSFNDLPHFELIDNHN